ncbi:MAG: macro domain-containing protein [Chlamydiota bacterium]
MINITIPNTPKDFNFQIRRDSILDINAQVIVNAANTQLTKGGGIDGLIHEKGGQAYASEHTKLSKAYQQNYPEGYATMLSSGDLATKVNSTITNVIVVAGPQSDDPDYETKLYNCYRNSLELAHKQGKTSIAFPSISTGIFGGDMNKSAEVAVKAVSDFMLAHPDTELKTISIHGYAVNDADAVGARRDDALIPAYQKAVSATPTSTS